jgi:hypothetical protein
VTWLELTNHLYCGERDLVRERDVARNMVIAGWGSNQQAERLEPFKDNSRIKAQKNGDHTQQQV